MPESIEKGSKRESGVTRVVEVKPDAEKAILDFLGRLFSSKNNKFPLEKEKPKELNEIISQISRYLKDFSARYGAIPLDIPPENVHILDETKMAPEQKEKISREFKNVTALFSFEDQHIFFLRIPSWASSPLGFATLVCHEMLHNISFQSAKLEPDEDNGLKGLRVIENRENENARSFFILPRRMGFRVFDAKNGTIYFNYLDESIISDLVSRFDREYFSKIPLISEGEEYKNRKDGQNADETSITERIYAQERRKLNNLIEGLLEENKDRFSSREEVFEMFARAVMTGRLLPIARLIEKTFGKGSFRELGENSGINPGKDKSKRDQ
jgi:hypothetical protein